MMIIKDVEYNSYLKQVHGYQLKFQVGDWELESIVFYNEDGIVGDTKRGYIPRVHDYSNDKIYEVSDTKWVALKDEVKLRRKCDFSKRENFVNLTKSKDRYDNSQYTLYIYVGTGSATPLKFIKTIYTKTNMLDGTIMHFKHDLYELVTPVKGMEHDIQDSMILDITKTMPIEYTPLYHQVLHLEAKFKELGCYGITGSVLREILQHADIVLK